jgi:hypothetical protein
MGDSEPEGTNRRAAAEIDPATYQARGAEMDRQGSRQEGTHPPTKFFQNHAFAPVVHASTKLITPTIDGWIHG